LLPNPLAPAVSPVRKANRLPAWADSVAEWAADQPFAAVEWVVVSVVVAWVAEASTAVAEWAVVEDMVAVAAIANVSEKLP
jgi:hypothetical protein